MTSGSEAMTGSVSAEDIVGGSWSWAPGCWLVWCDMMFTSETDCLMNMFWVLKICLIIGEFTIISCSIKHIYKYISKGWPLGGGKGMVTDIYNIQYASFTMFVLGLLSTFWAVYFQTNYWPKGPTSTEIFGVAGASKAIWAFTSWEKEGIGMFSEHGQGKVENTTLYTIDAIVSPTNKNPILQLFQKFFLRELFAFGLACLIHKFDSILKCLPAAKSLTGSARTPGHVSSSRAAGCLSMGRFP